MLVEFGAGPNFPLKDANQVCINFDARLAATPHSTLTGVIAAVIFTGIVLVIRGNPKRRDIEHSRQNAVLNLLPSFMGMLITSFCFAVLAGEADCRRAEASTVPVGALFAISAVSMVYGLVWLLDGFRATAPALSSLARSLFHVTVALVVVQMTITVWDFQQKYGANWAIGTLLLAYALAFIVYTGTRWFKGSKLEQRELDARAPARAMLVSIVILVISFNVLISLETEGYQSPSAPWIVLLLVVFSLLWMAFPVVLMLRTVPLRYSEKKWGEGLLEGPADGVTLPGLVEKSEVPDRGQEIPAEGLQAERNE